MPKPGDLCFGEPDALDAGGGEPVAEYLLPYPPKWIIPDPDKGARKQQRE